MTVSRAERRKAREPRVLAVFGADRTPRALDRLELVEFAWHDCYDEITPPEQIIDDIPLFRHRRMSRDCDPHWRRRAGNHPHVSTLAAKPVQTGAGEPGRHTTTRLCRCSENV